MRSESSAPQSAEDDLSRECLYRFLSVVVAGPYSLSWDRLTDAVNRDLTLEAARQLLAESDERDVSRLVEELNAPLDELRAQYEEVFGLVVPKECPPYETEFYPSLETFSRSQQMA